MDLHLGSGRVEVQNHRKGLIHLSQIGQSATLKNVSTKASDTRPLGMWSQSTFMIVYGKWVRTMYCEIPFLSRVLRIGEIIIQANSPIFGLGRWRCYNLLKYSIVPLDMCYILQQTLVMLTSWLHVALGNRHLKTNLELGTSSENKTSFAKPQFRVFFLQGWIPTSFTVSIHCQYSHQPPVFWNVKSLCQTLPESVASHWFWGWVSNFFPLW